MRVSRRLLLRFGRLGLISANLATALLLACVGTLIVLEAGWVHPNDRDPAEAFELGTIGTEIMPLPVARVLPALAPHHFQPAGPEAGDWIEQFGFLRRPGDPNGFPIGFAVSDYRPQTGAPSPVPFVGFTCALCHTTAIQTADDETPRIVTGAGSVSLNIFAWVDALRAALIERVAPPEGQVIDRENLPAYRLRADQIIEAYEKETNTKLAIAERLMIRLWLSQVRARLEASIPHNGEPFGNGQSRDERITPTGPSRTQPFRALMETLVHRPGNDMKVFSKMATVFSQDWRPRAQYDGSITELEPRSAFAAMAQGATAINMAKPEIADNIRSASAYTTVLRAPAFTEIFPGRKIADSATLARGREVYREHCFGCHGDRSGNEGWEVGPRTNTVIPLTEIGTDPERVTFRYYGEIPGLMVRVFGPRHPFRFAREVIYPQPGAENDLSARGYVAGPIDGAFLRAPYLHNASVLNLAELINLEPRREVFYRGRNLYDPDKVGFVSPPATDAKRYFKFDTSLVGNANAGHDYPWAYDDPARSESALRDLLEYLKSI